MKISRSLLLLIPALLAFGCFDSPYSRTVDQFVPSRRLPADPALGTLLLEVDGSRKVVFGQRPGAHGTYAFLAIWGGWNPDLTSATDAVVHGFHLPAGGGAPEPLPDWPFPFSPGEAEAGFALGVLLDGDGTVVAQRDGEQVAVAVLREGRWHVAGKMPTSRLPKRLVARSEREMLARDGDAVWAWSGTTWSQVALPDAGALRLGPWDGSAPTVLYRDASDRLCAAQVGLDGRGRGTPFCAEAPGGVVADDAIAGTFADHQVLLGIAGGARVVQRVGEKWAIGALVPFLATETTAPGAPLVACTPGDGSIVVPACARIEKGAAGDYVGGGYRPQIGCSGCSRQSDPSCDCLERGVTISQRFSQDGAVLSLLTVDNVDARTRIYFASFPAEGAPPAPLAAQGCGVDGCPQDWSCEGSGQSARCLPQDDGGELPAGWAWVTGSFSTAVQADEATVLLEVVPLDGGLFTVRAGPPDVRVEVEDGHRYRLELTAPGYESLSVLAESGDDLYTWVLARPRRLGLAVDARARVSPAGGAMALAAGGRWLFVREEGEGELEVVDLGEAIVSVDQPQAPRFSPDGSLLLIPGSGPQTPVFDGRSGASLGTIEGWVSLERTRFARGAPAMVVPTVTNQPGTAQPSRVFGWTQAGLQTLFEATNPGLADSLDPSGRYLARTEAGELAVYDLNDGTRTSFVGAYYNPQGARLLIGDGSQTLLAGLSVTGNCGEGTNKCALYLPDAAAPGTMKKVAESVLRFWSAGNGAVFLRTIPNVELVHLDLASGETRVLAAGRQPDVREYAGAAGPRLFAVDAAGGLGSWLIETGMAEPVEATRAWTSVAPGPGADLLLNAGASDSWAAIARGTDGVLELPALLEAEGLRFGSAHDRFGRVDVPRREVLVVGPDGERLVSRVARVAEEAGPGARAPCFLHRRVESPFGEPAVEYFYCSR